MELYHFNSYYRFLKISWLTLQKPCVSRQHAMKWKKQFREYSLLNTKLKLRNNRRGLPHYRLVYNNFLTDFTVTEITGTANAGGPWGLKLINVRSNKVCPSQSPFTFVHKNLLRSRNRLVGKGSPESWWVPPGSNARQLLPVLACCINC